MHTEYIHHLPEEWLPASAVFSALGDVLRQKILLLFEPSEELSIKTITDTFPVSRTTIVHHLSVLERAKILQSRRVGKESLYSIRPEVILEAVNRLQDYINMAFPPPEARVD